MEDEKVHKFRQFLKDKSDKIHADTWEDFPPKDPVSTTNWRIAKEKEILMGEISREFWEVFGKDEV